MAYNEGEQDLLCRTKRILCNHNQTLAPRLELNELLNPYQKTALTIVLRMFEENLRQALAWLDGRPIEGILYREEIHLAAPQRARARQRIAAALAEIAVLTQKAGLEPEIKDPSDLIRGQMGIAWANLVDSQTSKLNRFGAVNPEAGGVIDPHLQRLAQIALELTALFERQPPNPELPGDEQQAG